MTLPLSERIRQALRQLIARSEERHRDFERIETDYRERKQTIEHHFQTVLNESEQTYRQSRTRFEHSAGENRRKTEEHFAQEQTRLHHEQQLAMTKPKQQFELAEEQAQQQYKDNRWTIVTLHESDKKVAKDAYVDAQRLARDAGLRIKSQHDEARKLIRSWDFVIEFDVDVKKDSPVPDHDPANALHNYALRAGALLDELRAMRSPTWLTGWTIPLVTALVWLVLCLPALLMGSAWFWWILGATVVVWPIGLGARYFLTQRMSLFIAQRWEEICQIYVDAKRLRRLYLRQAQDLYKQQRSQSKKLHLGKIRKLLEEYRRHIETLTKRRDSLLAQAEKKYPPLIAHLGEQRRENLLGADNDAADQLAQLEKRHLFEQKTYLEKQAQQLQANEEKHRNEWRQMLTAWTTARHTFAGEISEVRAACRDRFPEWDKVAWETWPGTSDLPMGLPLGWLDFQPTSIAHGQVEDPRLGPLERHSLPALLSFPEKSSVLFRAFDEGRDVAVQALQALLFRAWTALPPGRMRCTILDPVSRGENFAAFMHLADQEESLVTSRIWTEPGHIEQRLADLTQHMETVLQKFLRNQYETLAEYNAQAGEVAEPFRFLVAANFPVNFGTEAARRLISLAQAGARCGIYTLVMVDLKQPMPQGVELADLEKVCSVLSWRQDQFHWHDPDFGVFPLTLETPPANQELATRILSRVGLQAKLAHKVEVPFERMAPAAEEMHTADSRHGIAVPLGRAGATGRQLLSLGKGTSQHVLIAGKTGSGKSTLLHVIITQLAMRYSPREVELYLIDFKKGVEFKTYASHRLPHARVVAVESEREFGLSVLQRLDAELIRRGELFRNAGVNDLAGYRDLCESPLSP